MKRSNSEIPNYQEIMLPMLRLLSDGEGHTFANLVQQLADHFQLTEDERSELLPTGRQPRFNNRVSWARTFLRKAELIENSNGMNRITPQGKKVLKGGVKKVDVEYLKRFPSFLEFINPKAPKNDDALSGITNELVDIPEESKTPEELLEQSYKTVRTSLASDILDRVLELSPAAFERLVVDLLTAMGYGGEFKEASAVTGKPGDGGIDGTIKEDKLGLDTIYIQAKRWKPEAKVGRPDLQQFVGALAGQRGKKGIFITTSSFSAEAKEYAQHSETRIVLIDGTTLAEFMIDYGLGCTTQKSYEIKKIDNDYFNAQ